MGKERNLRKIAVAAAVSSAALFSGGVEQKNKLQRPQTFVKPGECVILANGIRVCNGSSGSFRGVNIQRWKNDDWFNIEGYTLAPSEAFTFKDGPVEGMTVRESFPNILIEIAEPLLSATPSPVPTPTPIPNTRYNS